MQHEYFDLKHDANWNKWKQAFSPYNAPWEKHLSEVSLGDLQPNMHFWANQTRQDVSNLCEKTWLGRSGKRDWNTAEKYNSSSYGVQTSQGKSIIVIVRVQVKTNNGVANIQVPSYNTDNRYKY